MKRVRVLLTLASSSLTGPAERMLGDAEVLLAAGHEVVVAFDTRTEGNLAEVCRRRGLATAPELRLSRHSGPVEALGDVLRLRRRLRAGVDLVHAHFSHDHHVALLAARGLPARVVRSLEAPTPRGGWAFGGSALCISAWVPRAVLAQRAGARARGDVAVIEGAVDPARFSPGSGDKLRLALGCEPSTPVVGIVSRLKPERRHGDLVKAFGALAGSHPNARLAIVGRGEGRAELERAVGAAGLEGRVIFAGYWSGPDLVEAYRGLDVAVWLANGNDGGARGVLEAMAVGLPVVAYDVAPMRAQLADGAGVRVPVGDVGARGAALARLRGSPEERRAIGAKARARVLERYTWAQRGPKLLDLYARALRGPRV